MTRRLLALLAALAMAIAVPLAAAAAVIRTPAVESTPKSWSAEAAADGVRVQAIVNRLVRPACTSGTS